MVRFRAVVVLALFTSLITIEATRAAERSTQADRRPVIALAWFDPTGALPRPASLFATEVARLFEGWGMSVVWREGVAGATTTTDSELNVIVLRDSRATRPDILGEVAPGQDPHTAWVNLGAVARVLGMRPLEGRRVSDEEADQLVRAVARVVSHEIAHLVAPELPHTADGLMRARLGRRDLLGPTPTLEGGNSSFRTRLALFAIADVA